MPKDARFDPRQLMERAVQVMSESVAERRADGKASPLAGAVLWGSGGQRADCAPGRIAGGRSCGIHPAGTQDASVQAGRRGAVRNAGAVRPRGASAPQAELRRANCSGAHQGGLGWHRRPGPDSGPQGYPVPSGQRRCRAHVRPGSSAADPERQSLISRAGAATRRRGGRNGQTKAHDPICPGRRAPDCRYARPFRRRAGPLQGHRRDSRAAGVSRVCSPSAPNWPAPGEHRESPDTDGLRIPPVRPRAAHCHAPGRSARHDPLRRRTGGSAGLRRPPGFRARASAAMAAGQAAQSYRPVRGSAGRGERKALHDGS